MKTNRTTENTESTESHVAPDISRLIHAFRKEPHDRTPNFEIAINKTNAQALLGHALPDGYSFWNEDVLADVISMAKLVGQDAIPCALRMHAKHASVRTMDDIAAIVPPSMNDMRGKMERYLAAVKGTGIGVCANLAGPLTAAYMSAGPTAIESFMLMIYEQPELVARLLDLYTKFALDVIEATKDIPFHFFYIGDDVTGFMSPDHLAQLWAPREAKIIEAARATGRPVMCHCCGPMKDVLPFFADWKVNAINPVQTVVNDVYAIHEKYPDFTIVGNICVQELLSFGTPEAVAADTKEHIRRLSDRRGYVVASSHSIIDTVKPENYRALVEAAHAGTY
ncbi:MAG: uroporphyrinogen decarboxylase family protein [Spirochaetota bacterium]